MEFGWILEIIASLFLRPIRWIWGKVRLILPFPNEKKAFWNLTENLACIDWAISETNQQHFEMELRNLYPQLEKHGLLMPLIDPVRIGEKEYDQTWYGFHLTFLKVLRRDIRNKKFKFHAWNSDVARENSKRKNWVDAQYP